MLQESLEAAQRAVGVRCEGLVIGKNARKSIQRCASITCKTCKIYSTVETVETAETAETVETVETVETNPSFLSPLQSKAIFTSEFISRARALSIQENPYQVLNTQYKRENKENYKIEK